jgi:hypothetical protein
MSRYSDQRSVADMINMLNENRNAELPLCCGAMPPIVTTRESRWPSIPEHFD